jgi:hypothetical protein
MQNEECRRRDQRGGWGGGCQSGFCEVAVCPLSANVCASEKWLIPK